MTFVKENKNWIIHELSKIIDDLKDDHYSDAEFFQIYDIVKEKISQEQALWKKQEEDRKLLHICAKCKIDFGKTHNLEEFEGKYYCHNCLASQLICPKCKKGKLMFIKKEEKYCDIHNFHYATHRIFQCNNPKCQNIEINEIRHGWCD